MGKPGKSATNNTFIMVHSSESTANAREELVVATLGRGPRHPQELNALDHYLIYRLTIRGNR